MEIVSLSLPGVLLVKPRVHHDTRGYLYESYRRDLLDAAGLPEFVQDNHTFSVARSLRGLHYQLERPQGKLIRVARGAVFDVAVDIRVGSPTFGRWVGETLTDENHLQLYIPPGFAHGFCVLSDVATVLYRCTDYYSGAADQRGVIWNDLRIRIAWPVEQPLLSDKDRGLPPLDPARADLPRFASLAEK
jgi:dTDP-4-dehydrorhamnose 3,5-epimerase